MDSQTFVCPPFVCPILFGRAHGDRARIAKPRRLAHYVSKHQSWLIVRTVTSNLTGMQNGSWESSIWVGSASMHRAQQPLV